VFTMPVRLAMRWRWTKTKVGGAGEVYFSAVFALLLDLLAALAIESAYLSSSGKGEGD
jgi:hypothetical protein